MTVVSTGGNSTLRALQTTYHPTGSGWVAVDAFLCLLINPMKHSNSQYARISNIQPSIVEDVRHIISIPDWVLEFVDCEHLIE
jgi:hypothetical protein